MALTTEAREYLHRLAEEADCFSGADLQGIVTTAQLAALHDAIDAASKDHEAQAPSAELQSSVTIEQRHLEDAFKPARPSLSASERARYQRVYDRFVAARNTTDGGFDPNGKQRTISA